MKPGISTACFYPRYTEESLALLGEYGVKTCEIFFNTLSEIEPSYVKQLRRTADAYGMQVVSAHPFTCPFEPFMLFTGYDRRFRDGIEWHKRYFEIMNLLGSEIFVFHGDRADGALCDEEYFERFAVLRDLGKSFGITVAQENVGRCRSRSLPFLENMASYLGGDLRLVFDNKQARRSGVDELEFINRLGRYICHVHISDAEASGDCTALRENSPHIVPVINALKAIGYNSAVLIELYRGLLKSEDEIFASYETLKKYV